MAVLVISGSGRGAGKTAVGCSLLAALPEFRWLAVKLTPHRHSSVSLFEETDSDSQKDTGRFLRAGAAKALLLASGGETAQDLAQKLRQIRAASECDSLLIESNHLAVGEIAVSGEPSVSLAVLDGSFAKKSLLPAMGRADAFITSASLSLQDLRAAAPDKPVFELPADEWSSPELAAFVRRKLLP